MLMAIIGDIHGNLPALEAVLEPIEAAGIETILNTGDTIVGFPWPNEVVDMLRGRGVVSVQGEMDRLTAAFPRKGEGLREKWAPSHFEALRWSYEHTRGVHLEWLRSLPKQRRLMIEGVPMTLCHGTVSNQNEALSPDDADERFRRQREIATDARIIACGRTHRAYARLVDDTLFVNPGSVGLPPDQGSFAAYALVNTEEEPYTAELHRVEYDFGPVLECLAQSGLERP